MSYFDSNSHVDDSQISQRKRLHQDSSHSSILMPTHMNLFSQIKLQSSRSLKFYLPELSDQFSDQIQQLLEVNDQVQTARNAQVPSLALKNPFQSLLTQEENSPITSDNSFGLDQESD